MLGTVISTLAVPSWSAVAWAAGDDADFAAVAARAERAAERRARAGLLREILSAPSAP